MTTTVPLKAQTTRQDRRGTLTWAGPGQPFQLAPGSTLRRSERLAVLAFLTNAQAVNVSDALADAVSSGEPGPWYATSSAEALTMALGGLAGATGVAPLWLEAEGLALEVPDLVDAAEVTP